MATGNSNSNQPDTKTQKNIGQVKEIPQINQQAALLILKQLIENKQTDKIQFSPLFAPINRELSKQALIAFLKANQDLTKQLKAELELPVPIDVAIESEIPAVLQSIRKIFIASLPPEAREQETIKQTILPNPEQLQRWQEELKLWQEAHARAQQKTNQALPDFLSLKKQIELIQKFHGQVENIAEKHLEQHWSPDERKLILQRISQHITQKTIEKKSPLTQLETQTIIEELCEQDFIVGVGLPTKERAQITKELHQHFASPETQRVITKLPNAQNSLNTVVTKSTPTRNELRQILQQQLGLPPTKAERLLRKLEKDWPKNPIPTQADIAQIIENNLPFAGFVSLIKQGVPLESVPRHFWLLLEGYYKNTPLAQALEKFNLPISPTTYKWVDRLKKGLKVNPVVLDNWFRGVSSQFIAEQRNRLLPADQTAQPGSEAEKLELLYRETKAFENHFQKLPKLTQ